MENLIKYLFADPHGIILGLFLFAGIFIIFKNCYQKIKKCNESEQKKKREKARIAYLRETQTASDGICDPLVMEAAKVFIKGLMVKKKKQKDLGKENARLAQEAMSIADRYCL